MLSRLRASLTFFRSASRGQVLDRSRADVTFRLRNAPAGNTLATSSSISSHTTEADASHIAWC